MKVFNILKLSLLFNTLLISNKVYTKAINDNSSNDSKSIKNKNESVKDEFYMVFVDEKCLLSSNIQKRDSTENKEEQIKESVFSMVNEIHELIVENKDTFRNITEFEEINNESKFGKREDVEYVMDYGESNLIYPIGSSNDKSVLHAFLSPELVQSVEEIPCIESITKDVKAKLASEEYYNKIDILNYTGWNGLKIKENAPIQLSLISQGIVNNDFISEYDTNYYCPKSAGKGVDVFVMDRGFNFDFDEFENEGRTAKCVLSIENGRVAVKDTKVCTSGDSTHGHVTSEAIGGYEYGAANQANVYGINFDDIWLSNYIAFLIHMKNNLIKSNPTVVNMSIYWPIYDYKTRQDIKLAEIIINELSNRGVVFVASAGNEKSLVHNGDFASFPCFYDNVICVGGYESREFKGEYKKHESSCYGEGVNFYAPYTVYIKYPDLQGNINTEYVDGTSLSGPVVSGVVATILSDRNRRYTTKEMLELLTELGEENVITGVPDNTTAPIVNNGKRIVYSKNNYYDNDGCGVHAGNKECTNN